MSNHIKLESLPAKFFATTTELAKNENYFEDRIQAIEMASLTKPALIVTISGLFVLAALALAAVTALQGANVLSLPQHFQVLTQLGNYNYIIAGATFLIAGTILFLASLRLHRNRKERESAEIDIYEIEFEKKLYDLQLETMQAILVSDDQDLIYLIKQEIKEIPPDAYIPRVLGNLQEGKFVEETRPDRYLLVYLNSVGQLTVTKRLTSDQKQAIISYWKAKDKVT